MRYELNDYEWTLNRRSFFPRLIHNPNGIARRTGGANISRY
jgi:hypothetical protein